MNKFLRLSAIIMVCVLLVPGFALAGAKEGNQNEGGYLGTDDNVSGQILPEEKESDCQGRAVTFPVQIGDGVSYYEIFTITANEVYDMLPSSKGGKSFRINDLPSGAAYILCYGILNHSLAGQVGMVGPIVTAGVCDYHYSSQYGDYIYDSIYIVEVDEFELGTVVTKKKPISGYLVNNTTYYSYVKNEYPAGYVSGTFKIYYSYA